MAVECVRPPPLAVTVRSLGPGVACGDAMSTIVMVPAPGAARVDGLRVAVTPLGSTVVVSVIELLNPPPVTVLPAAVVCPPCAILTAVGETDRLKSAVGVGAVTAIPKLVLFVTPLGAVPRIVSVYWPGGAEAASRVRVDCPDGAGFGAKVTVAPGGTPDASSEIGPIP